MAVNISKLMAPRLAPAGQLADTGSAALPTGKEGMAQAIEALVLDLGGRGPAMHLAHANGFPPGTYRQLAAALADSFHVMAMPARPLWPGCRPADLLDWRAMAADLVTGLEATGLAPVIGVGHSLGGVLTCWAAIDRPDLFAGVILVDPVLLPPSWLRLLRLLRALGMDHHQPLVRSARRRRRRWPSRQACFDHWRGKRFFARWSDAALWDYVNSGTEPAAEGGVQLRYSAEWEAQIFATVPVNVWQDVPRLAVPTLFVRGEESNTFLQSAAARVARLLPAAQHETVPGAGHLVPMEKPTTVAGLVCDFVRAHGLTP